MKYKPLELRIMLYDVVHRLRRQGLTYREIIQEVEKSYNVRLPISTVYFWLKEVYNPKRGTKLLPKTLNPVKICHGLSALSQGMEVHGQQNTTTTYA